MVELVYAGRSPEELAQEFEPTAQGDAIAFTKLGQGAFGIGVIKPDGSGERLLIEGFHNEGPTWAPNGRVVTFFRDPGGNAGPSLFTIDITGRNEQKIPTPSYASDPRLVAATLMSGEEPLRAQ